MPDLRAKVEGLRVGDATTVPDYAWKTEADKVFAGWNAAIKAAAALIPEGAVLVTVGTLAAALDSVERGIASRHPEATVVSQRKAAAILAKLREPS